MENRRRDKYYWTIIVLLIIIILILLYFNHIGEVTEKSLKPNGNVDVFDIDINCKCDNVDCNKKNNSGKSGVSTKTDDSGKTTDYGVIDYSSNTNPDKEVPVYDEEEDEDILGLVFVDDANGNYLYQQNLKIFTNSAFDYDDEKIAPGVSNTYHFVVHNSSNVNLKYQIEMYEKSEYKINMKYRLKRNNEYVIGSDTKWVSASELNIKDLKIKDGHSDSYSLDWKWEYNGGKDKQDTIAGEKMTSKYALNVRFHFESYD